MRLWNKGGPPTVWSRPKEMPDLSGVSWGILFDLVVNGERHRLGPCDDIGMSQERPVVEAFLKTYEMRKTK